VSHYVATSVFQLAIHCSDLQVSAVFGIIGNSVGGVSRRQIR